MAESDKLVIHHIEGRRSHRVIWACEELDIPYSLSFRQGDVYGSLNDVRRAFPAMPMTPVVQFGDQWLVESGAIIELLAMRDEKRRLIPALNSTDYARHLQWMHFAEATMLSRLLLTRALADAKGTDPRDIPGYRASTWTEQDLPQAIGPQGAMEFVAAYLAEFPYFGGERFSIADIMMHFSLKLAKLLIGAGTDDYPAIARWRKTVEARPAFARANEAATPKGADEFGLPLGLPLPYTLLEARSAS